MTDDVRWAIECLHTDITNLRRELREAMETLRDERRREDGNLYEMICITDNHVYALEERLNTPQEEPHHEHHD
jgi:Mg-chelatase subunit ChlD